MIARLAARTELPLTEAKDHFAAQGARDALVEMSGQLRALAVALIKIANDLRWMGSGPRTGLAEIRLPDLQPGSSIMPGKVNPVIPEVVTQVGAQVIGNDAAIAFAGSQGNFELNVYVPVIARNLLESIRAARQCVHGVRRRSASTASRPNVERLQARTRSRRRRSGPRSTRTSATRRRPRSSRSRRETGRSIREIVQGPQADDRRRARPGARRRGHDARRDRRVVAGHEGSTKAVIAAFFANLGIAIAKFVVFFITGAASMLAGSDPLGRRHRQPGLAAVSAARRAARPPDDEHPFGYGNRRYFWAFIVALVLFSVGGLFAIYEGIEKLRHPARAREPRAGRSACCSFAIVLESVLVPHRDHRGEQAARSAGQSCSGSSASTKRPELPVVLLEDIGALIGLVIALFGVTWRRSPTNGPLGRGRQPRRSASCSS